MLSSLILLLLMTFSALAGPQGSALMYKDGRVDVYAADSSVTVEMAIPVAAAINDVIQKFPSLDWPPKIQVGLLKVAGEGGFVAFGNTVIGGAEWSVTHHDGGELVRVSGDRLRG